jgi:hypothetical protein
MRRLWPFKVKGGQELKKNHRTLQRLVTEQPKISFYNVFLLLEFKDNL